MICRLHIYITVVLLLLSVGSVAQTRKELEEQRKKTLKEIEETNQYLNNTQKDQKESLEKLNLLNAQIYQYDKLISGMGSEIRYVDRQINQTNTEIGKMSREIDKLKSEYALMVYHAYKNKGKYNKLIYMLSAKDFNEAYRRMKYFQQYSEFRQAQVVEITEAQQQLGKQIKLLEQQKAEKEKLLSEQRKESKQLESVKNQQSDMVNQLKSRERDLKKQLAEKQKQADKIQSEIQKLIAAETKKRKGTSKNLYDNLTPEEKLVSNYFKDNKGRLPWPTEKGIITRYFGVNPHPVYKDIRINNNGIDITTVGEASVRAVFEGEVTRVLGIHGENLTVLLRHGNYITIYQNIVDVSVKQGDKVKFKETIGKVYTEKGSKMAVLHFEIWEETQKLNPELWLIKK